MSWFLVGGAAIGAAYGSYKADRGGSKDDIWKGAIIGGTAGWAGGAMMGAGSAGGLGSSTPIIEGFGAQGTGQGAAMMGGVATPAASTGGGIASMFGNPANVASMAGVGMNMLGGGSATGSAPSANIPLTKTAKEGEKNYFEAAKKDYINAKDGILPPNMASIVIGRLRQQAGSTERDMAKVVNSAGFGDTRGSGGAAAGLVAAGSKAEGELSPTAWVADTRRKMFINSLNSLNNVYNIESQAPILKANALLAQTGFEQYQDAQQGEAIGSAIELAGMMNYRGKVMA